MRGEGSLKASETLRKAPLKWRAWSNQVTDLLYPLPPSSSTRRPNSNEEKEIPSSELCRGSFLSFSPFSVSFHANNKFPRATNEKVVKPSTCTDTRVENSSPFLRNYSIDTRRWFEFWSRVIDNNFLLEIRGIKRIYRTFDTRYCVSGLIWGVIFLLIRVNVRVEISYSGWRKKRECKKTRGKLFLFCIRWKFFIRSTYESVYESMYFENFSAGFFFKFDTRHWKSFLESNLERALLKLFAWCF